MPSLNVSALFRSLVLGLGILVASATWAQAPAATSSEEAKRLFEDARKEFNLGEFRAAAEKYKQVYRLKPDPALLYNIAQSYRLGGDLPNALFFYRTYQRNATDMNAAMKREVESRIKQLEEQIGSGTTQVPSAPRPTTPEPAEPAKPEPAKPEPAKPMPEPVKPVTTEPTKPEPAKPTPEPTKPEPNLNLPTTTTTVAVESKPTPAYKKWWVWTIVGIAVVGIGVGVGVGVALSAPSSPSSELGTYKAF